MTVPDAYSQVVQAKLNRDRQSFEDFRKVDQRLHDAQRKREIDARMGELRESIHDYRLNIAELEADATSASAVFTLADQHAAKAEKYALEQRHGWELVRGDRLEDGTPPGELVEAEIRAEKASRVAVTRRGEADSASIALYDAEAALEAARAGLAEDEEQLRRWGIAAGLPTVAPLSDVTARVFAGLIREDNQIRESLSAKDITRAEWAGTGVSQGAIQNLVSTVR